MLRIVNVSQKYLNNVKPAIDNETNLNNPNGIVDKDDELQLEQIKYIDKSVNNMESSRKEKLTLSEAHGSIMKSQYFK